MDKTNRGMQLTVYLQRPHAIPTANSFEETAE
jgi:hypothetical protein